MAPSMQEQSAALWAAHNAKKAAEKAARKASKLAKRQRAEARRAACKPVHDAPPPATMSREVNSHLAAIQRSA